MEDAVITKTQAKSLLLVKKGMVHTFYNFPCGIIGADHTEKSILKDIDESFMCKLTGPQAKAMGHGIAIIPRERCTQNDILFVETDMDEVEKLEKKRAKKR